MLDLVHLPERAAARQANAVRSLGLGTPDEWACTIVPNPPAAMLLVERRGAGPARDVRVLIDGKPAKDDPTVYADAIVPDALARGAELEYRLVLPRSGPSFDALEVRWTDEAGRRRACRCDVVDHAAGARP